MKIDFKKEYRTLRNMHVAGVAVQVLAAVVNGAASVVRFLDGSTFVGALYAIAAVGFLASAVLSVKTAMDYHGMSK